MAITFRPAQHSAWILLAAQLGNALDLLRHDRLRLHRRDLAILKTLPRGAGLILAANHADEMDIRICMELARRARRRFTYMVNAEAFEEGRGLAGWWLQRLGCFSVERGGGDLRAKQYALETVKAGREVLVTFPEGEIYYLNDLVQVFKTGVVHTGLQAIIEARRTHPRWTAYLLPVAIKYSYRWPIEAVLSRRIAKMKKRLFRRRSYLTAQEQLARIMAQRLRRQSEALLGRAQRMAGDVAKLADQVRDMRAAIVSRMEARYRQAPPDPRARLMDRANKMIFFLREQLRRKRLFSPETQLQLQEDLADVKRTIQMAGWQPRYMSLDPSEERLAETVMKLERDVFGRKRPRPLGQCDVFLRIGPPLDLAPYVEAYQADPSAVSHQLAESLRDTIQSLIAS